MQIIKPGTNIDFMGKRKILIAISSILMLASIVSLVLFGLNLGIDFKGGTKLIVAVDKDNAVSAAELRATLDRYVREKTGIEGTQIEVQNFAMGSTDTQTKRYVIYTELESLVSTDQRNAIKDKLQANPLMTTVITDDGKKENDSVYVSMVEQGAPKFFMTWKEGKEICSLYCAGGLTGHTIQAGETCVSIATANKMEVKALVAANSDLACDAALPANNGICVGKPDPAQREDHCVQGREADIAAAFAAIKLEGTSLTLTDIAIESDWERRFDLEYYETQALVEEDRSTGDTNPGGLSKHRKRHEQDKMRRKATEKGRSFTIRVDEFKSDVGRMLQEEYPNANVSVESSTSVSASVGRDLLANGLVAMLYALIGILGYIGLRFDFRYSPGAVMALAHDSLITIGIFSILQIKFTQPIIAAILTIIGYSLNDTIVVFDRIRENIGRYRGKELAATINTSINETLSRTLLTSFTTLIVVVSILVFGGGLIKDFAFALLIGIIVGTYSSIFIASPVVLYMDGFFKRRSASAKETNPVLSKSS